MSGVKNAYRSIFYPRSKPMDGRRVPDMDVGIDKGMISTKREAKTYYKMRIGAFFTCEVEGRTPDRTLERDAVSP